MHLAAWRQVSIFPNPIIHSSRPNPRISYGILCTLVRIAAAALTPTAKPSLSNLIHAMCMLNILASFVSIQLCKDFAIRIVSSSSDRFLDAFSTVLLIDNGIDANPEHKQNEMRREKKMLNNERKLTYMGYRRARESISIYPFRIDAACSADERFLFEIIHYYYYWCVCVCVNVVWVCAHCEPLFVNSAYRTLLHCTINGREEDKDKIIEKAIWQTAYKMKAMELPNRKCHQPSADRTVCPNIHRNEHIKFRRNQSYINLNTYLLHRLTSVDSACIDGWRIAVSLFFFYHRAKLLHYLFVLVCCTAQIQSLQKLLQPQNPALIW